MLLAKQAFPLLTTMIYMQHIGSFNRGSRALGSFSVVHMHWWRNQQGVLLAQRPSKSCACKRGPRHLTAFRMAWELSMWCLLM